MYPKSRQAFPSLELLSCQLFAMRPAENVCSVVSQFEASGFEARRMQRWNLSNVKLLIGAVDIELERMWNLVRCSVMCEWYWGNFAELVKLISIPSLSSCQKMVQVFTGWQKRQGMEDRRRLLHFLLYWPVLTIDVNVNLFSAHQKWNKYGNFKATFRLVYHFFECLVG